MTDHPPAARCGREMPGVELNGEPLRCGKPRDHDDKHGEWQTATAIAALEEARERR